MSLPSPDAAPAEPTSAGDTRALTQSRTKSPAAASPTASPVPAAAQSPQAAPGPEGERATVASVTDGDTVRLTDGRAVRIVGVDTPERGQCGFGPASSNLRRLVEGREVVLIASAKTDTDRYDRLLRYVEVDGLDAGRDQIAGGYGIARYDSRDGYGRHAREDDYVALDAATPDPSCGTADVAESVHPYPTSPSAPATRTDVTPLTARSATAPPATPTAPQAFAAVPQDTADSAPAAGGAVSYANCAAVRAAGAAPLHRGSPGYSTKLDRDGDGVACES